MSSGSERTIPDDAKQHIVREDQFWAWGVIREFADDGRTFAAKATDLGKLGELFLGLCLIARHPVPDAGDSGDVLRSLRNPLDTRHVPGDVTLGLQVSALYETNIIAWTAYLVGRRLGLDMGSFRDGTVRLRIGGSSPGTVAVVGWKPKLSYETLAGHLSRGRRFLDVMHDLGAYDWFSEDRRCIYDLEDGASVALKFTGEGTLASVEKDDQGYWNSHQALEDIITAFRGLCF
jgi:hypothetical protein